MSLPEEISPRSLMRIGARGKVNGFNVQLLGYIRCAASDDEDTWYWEEWYCGTINNQELWIEFDEESHRFTFFEKLPQVSVLNHEDVDQGDQIELSNGDSFKVTEKSLARITMTVGTLPEGHTRDSTFTYYESSGTKREGYSIEVSDEVEVFKSLRLKPKEFLTELQLPAALEKWQWVARQYDRSDFIFAMVVAAIIISIGVILYGFFSGKTAFEQTFRTCQSTLPAQPCGAEEIYLGPFTLDKANRAHKIVIKTTAGINANNWQDVKVTLTNADKEPLSAFSGEFWLENWVEDGESGTETNLAVAKYFRLTESGEYYAKIEFTPISANPAPLIVNFKILEGVYYWPYFTTVLAGSFGLGLFGDKRHRLAERFSYSYW